MIVIVVAILLAGAWPVMAALTALSVAVVLELSAAFGFCKKETWPVAVYMLLSVFLVELLSVSVLSAIDTGKRQGLFLLYLIIGFAIALIYCGAPDSGKRVKLRDFLSVLALSLFSSYCLSSAINLRMDTPQGKYLIWLVPVAACMTDAAALFSGKFFGRHPLAPSISPKKTVEGAIGGTIVGILAVMLCGWIFRLIEPTLSVSYPRLFVLAVLAVIAAQLGDLSMSQIKREVGIKDYGNFIPGHGGILDRLDSVIFTAPVLYYFMLILPVFA